VQRTRTFTGIDGIHQQDQAATESMGAITDHSFENLASSDRRITMTRKRILGAAAALAETGALPPGASNADVYGRMRGGFFVAPETRQWPDVYHLQAAALAGPGAIAAAE